VLFIEPLLLMLAAANLNTMGFVSEVNASSRGHVEYREEPEHAAVYSGSPQLMEDEEYVANIDEDDSRAEENAARGRVAARFRDRFEQIQQYYASLNGADLE
jgi:hypothetical protein